MRPADRALVLAAAASAALHLAALFGVPRFDLGPPQPQPSVSPSIQARLVLAEAPAPAVARPAGPTDRARSPARRSAPAPRPIAPAPVVSGRDEAEPAPDAASGGEPTLAARAGPEDAAVGAGDAAVEAPAAPPAEEIAPAVEYPLRHARLVFDLYYGTHATKVGQVTHTFAQAGGEYRVEAVAEAVGFASWLFSDRLVLRATGRVAAAGLLPAEYRAEIGPRGRAEVASFDWSEGKVALAAKGVWRRLELPAGAQDPLSMLHQAYFMQPLPDVARRDIATGRKLHRYDFHVVGEMQLETPLGIVRALQIRGQDPDGTRLEIWLDLDRDLLPARVQAVSRKGAVLEQVIRERRLELAADAR